MKKKILTLFAFGIILFSAAFFFRNCILTMGMKSFLTKTFPQNLSYQEITTKDDRIYVYGLKVQSDQMELHLDGLELGLDAKKLLLNPRSFWKLYKTGFTNWMDLLPSFQQYEMDLSIQSGVLRLEEKRYYFQFKRGENKHDVGTLCVFHDPGLSDHPFFTTHLQLRQSQLISQILLEEVPSERFFQLATFAFPQTLNGLTGAQGHMHMRANVVLDFNGSIQEVSSRFGCTNFEIQQPKRNLAIKMDRLKGELNYPEGVEEQGLPVWKKMQCSIGLENGTLLAGGQFALAQLQGNVALDPRVDPSLNLHGEVIGQEKPLALALVGKGAIHEDHAYWLEFGLNLDDHSGTECDAFLSICRPEEDSLVFQVEANQLLPQQVEMLKGYFAKSLPRLKDWEVQQGNVGGKLVALFEKGQLAHFEIQDLVGKNVSLASQNQLFYFSEIKGEGRLFDELTFETKLPVAHFFAFASPQLKDIFSSYRPDDFANLCTTIQFHKDHVRTSASVDFLELGESIQFGFVSSRAFPSTFEEIKSGWARSKKLSHLLYGPFVRLANEDLKLYGDIDLLASYEGKEIELSFQIDDFLAKHPLVDLRSDAVGSKDATTGRAKFLLNPFTYEFVGSLPLTGAKAYERRYGLLLDPVDAQLQITPSSIKGSLSSCDISFDGKKLLQNGQLDFVCAGQTTLSNIKAQLALPTDKEFWIAATHLDADRCDFRLLDKEEPLATFIGTKKENWSGELKLQALADPLDLALSWDPIANSASLTGTSEALSFHITKDGQTYHCQELNFGSLRCSGQILPQERGWILPSSCISHEAFVCKTAGSLFFDLPQKDAPCQVRSELDVSLKLLAPVPLTIQAAHPVQFSYTHGKGFDFSQVEFNSGENGISLPQLEWDPSEGTLETAASSFRISQDLLQEFFDAKALPKLLGDFQACKGLKGEGKITSNRESFSFDGSLASKKGDQPLHFSWKNKKAHFCLGEDHNLAFVATCDENGLVFNTISGSYQNITVDLRQLGKDRLKGSVRVDFSFLEDLFDLPLNSVLSSWKAKSGYHFEGIFTPNERLKDWGFKGKLKGTEFECGDYKLRTIEAKLDIEPGQIHVEHLDLTDGAGKVWIEEGSLSHHEGQWYFSFPLVEVRGFQPSILRRVLSPEKGVSPLIIKTASLTNLQGNLKSMQSITGGGSLRFSNKSSQGNYPLFEHLPIAILQQLGLDEEIFVPVTGEVDYTIQNGRLYFKEMRNILSDRNRSEFIPPRSGVIGYLDFAGNLFLDLQVRPRGGRGTAPSKTFKARGTWENPDITIR